MKVGDKVQVIGTSTLCSRRCKAKTGECARLGDIGIITKMEKNGKISVEHFTRSKMWCSGFEAAVLKVADHNLSHIINQEVKRILS